MAATSQIHLTEEYFDTLKNPNGNITGDKLAECINAQSSKSFIHIKDAKLDDSAVELLTKLISENTGTIQAITLVNCNFDFNYRGKASDRMLKEISSWDFSRDINPVRQKLPKSVRTNSKAIYAYLLGMYNPDWNSFSDLADMYNSMKFVEPLFLEISKCTKLRVLEFKDCRFLPSDWTGYLPQVITQCQRLETLRIIRCGVCSEIKHVLELIGDDELPVLCELDLSFNSLALDGDEDKQRFRVFNLHQVSGDRRDFDYEKYLTPRITEAQDFVSKSLAGNTSLKKLNLKHTEIDFVKLCALSAALIKNSTLEDLAIAIEPKVGAGACIRFFDAVASNKGLKNLTVKVEKRLMRGVYTTDDKFIESINDAVSMYIANMLEENNSLRALKLFDCDNLTRESISRIKQALARNNKLESLEINGETIINRQISGGLTKATARMKPQ